MGFDPTFGCVCGLGVHVPDTDPIRFAEVVTTPYLYIMPERVLYCTTVHRQDLGPSETIYLPVPTDQ